MKKPFWEKRIPTYFGLILIVAGVLITSFAVRLTTNFFGIAAPPETPDEVRISNISDSSFTISYKTETKVLGSISYGTDKNLGATVRDDRDQLNNNLNTYNIHYFTLKNLKPLTKYYFTITSGQTTFLENEKSFEVTLGPAINQDPPNDQPVLGKILFPKENSEKEAVVYLTMPNAQTISSLVKSDGTYIIPLNSIRAKSLDSYLSFPENTPLEILVVAQKNQSQASFKTGKTNVVPLITLSKNYDFTIDTQPVATFSGSIGFPFYTASASGVGKDPQIIAPKNNEGFSDQKPLFKGVASPGSSVKIIIQSENEIKADVKADNKGNWSFRPSFPLSPGQHTISISAIDQYGILKTITQSFVVYAEGTQVNQSATPSATPTLIIQSPTPTFTPSPSPVSTIIPTQTPTLILTSSPTPTPIPTIGIVPSTTPKTIVPVVGNSSLITASLTVLATTIVGIILFLFTRKASL